MLYRSKAPFRLGIAGGGTDVSPYSNLYGGAILNVTVNLYAHATIRPLDNGKIRFVHINENITEEFDAVSELPLDGPLVLQHGIYNSIVSRYNNGEPLSFELITQMDVPSGSGLGTSSTLVVAILGAFTEWLRLPLGKYDIAHYAYEIERIDLNMAGGKQDQYAATFGGVNFMEFLEDDKVIVNPLRIGDDILQEWAMNTVLFYTEQQRCSGKIIEEQAENVKNNKNDSLEAMHNVKHEAFRMKNCLLREELQELGKRSTQAGPVRRKWPATSPTNLSTIYTKLPWPTVPWAVKSPVPEEEDSCSSTVPAIAATKCPKHWTRCISDIYNNLNFVRKD